jgi:hypothetical protein
MISPLEIQQKADRLYPDFLRSIVTNQPMFPRSFSVGKLPTDYVQLSVTVNKLLEHSKLHLNYGYTVELTSRNTRKYGDQTLPSKIWIETERDYLKLIQKEAEVATFRVNLALIRERIPALDAWVNQYPLKVIEFGDRWDELLKVCQYFQHHDFQPPAKRYIRELPIAVHTKFIETHRGILRSLLDCILPPENLRSLDLEPAHLFEQRFCLRYAEPLIRLRLLDSSLQQTYQLPFTDFSLPLSDLSQFDLSPHPIVITENLMNFLTLPSLTDCIAIFGSGFGVQNLRSLPWLQHCPIYYWGDLDVSGFRILGQLRSHFPQVVSVMMNLDTLNAFEPFAVKLAVKVEAIAAESSLPLTADERDCLDYLVKYNLRLEQERLTQSFVAQQFQTVMLKQKVI